MKTPTLKQSQIQRNWHLVDIKDQILGRTATQIAQLLIGKHKVNFSPNLDNGDYVVVINSDQVKFSSKNKLENKKYYRHSGHAGGFKQETLKQKLADDSRKVVRLAVKNMLPKNKMRKPRLARLKIYKNDRHPHKSQIKNSQNGK